MTTLAFTLSPASTAKIHDALSCLSKFSDQISLEARRNQLCLSALNSTKSAYVAVALAANRFFDEYTYVGEGGEERWTCRLQAKALLSVFRQRYVDAKDKSTAIQRCEVRLSSTDSSTQKRTQDRLLVRLLCNHGVLKTYKLTYEEVDIMHAIFDKDSAPQRWRISSALLKEYMEHFGPRAEQLDISSATSTGRAAFTSFTEKLIDGKEILKQPLQTSVALDTSDFEEFEVEDGLHVAVSLKDFKAITQHAITLEVPVEAYYSKPGKPMQVGYARDGMDVSFTLMTAADVRSSQNFAAMGRIVAVQRERTERVSPARRERQETTAPPPEPTAPPPPSQRSSRAVTQPSPSFRQPSAIPRTVTESTDSSLYRLPSPRPSVETTQAPPPVPPPPPPPPAEPPIKEEPVEVPLFLNYSSAEEDRDTDLDDFEKSLEQERGGFRLGWNTSEPQEVGSGNARKRSVVESEDEEMEDEGVGPTQQSGYVPKGLFDD